MDVTPIALASINAGVTTAYNTQFAEVQTVFDKYTYIAASTGDQEVYPRVDLLPGLREWRGERKVNWLTLTDNPIVNKTYEGTIGVRRENIEDDKYGFLTQAAQQMGLSAGRLPDLLVAALMASGTTVQAVDGANFFDVDHENYSATGAITTNINYQAGAGPSWYLMCTKDITKPFIFQKRRPFQVRALFDPNSEAVFEKNEFKWGNDGRCAAGYGLWHYVFRSDAALTVANLEAARAAMASWRRPDGSPLGIMADTLVTGIGLGPTAKSYCINDFLPPTDPLAAGVGTVANTFKGLATAVENPWIP